MSLPTPANDPHDAMQKAMRRDAARIQEPPFDAALHHATMRRIRALTAPPLRSSNWWWKPALAGVAALAVVLGIFVGRMPVSPNSPGRPTGRIEPDSDAALASVRAMIASVSFKPAETIPSWMSPTASLLNPPEKFSASIVH